MVFKSSLRQGGSGGVTTVDGITGAVTLVAGTGVTIADNSPVAGDITISASGSGAVSSVSNSDGTLTISPTTGAVVASLAALPSAEILVGNGSNVATGVAMSGDLSISNAGVTTLNKIQGVSVTGVTGTGNAVLSASPALTGAPTATTADGYTNTTQLATTAFTQSAINLSMATYPLNLGGSATGTYSFASLGINGRLIFVASGGAITGVNSVAVAGTGYAVGDILTAIEAGSNNDAMIRVSSVNGSGGITGATVLYGGNGYTNGFSGLLIIAISINFPFTYTITGTLSGNVTFIIPNGTYLINSQQFIVNNNTTGAYTMTWFLSNGSDATTGTGVVIPQGSGNSRSILVQTDGKTDLWLSAVQNAADLAGTTLASGVTASSLTSFGASIVLGTPASGVATNLTGTATALNIGGNAATVTNGVYTNAATNFTAQQNFGSVTTNSSSNSTAWNLATAQNAKQAMVENTTLANPTNQVDGGVYQFRFTQNASVAKTLAFGTAYIFSGNSTVNAALSSVTLYTFVSDGTNMRGVMTQWAS